MTASPASLAAATAALPCSKPVMTWLNCGYDYHDELCTKRVVAPAVALLIDAARESEREACAAIADAQRTDAPTKRRAKGMIGAKVDPDAWVEISAEERGEEIASEMIAAAIRARKNT